MSNPNGSSSVQDLRICMFFTEIDEKGNLEVKETTVKIFSPNTEEFMQIPVKTHVVGENNKRTSTNGDVYEKKKNKIVITKSKSSNLKNNIDKEKLEDKKRA